jgi:hypothetical protein
MIFFSDKNLIFGDLRQIVFGEDWLFTNVQLTPDGPALDHSLL